MLSNNGVNKEIRKGGKKASKQQDLLSNGITQTISDYKEGLKMSANGFLEERLNIGAIIGLVMFAVIGMLPASYLGGMLGLQIADFVSNMTQLTRIIFIAAAAFGTLAVGLAFILGASFIHSLICNCRAAADRRYRNTI